MSPLQLKELIHLVLKIMGRFSAEAVDLLMVTTAQESHCGKYIRQLGGGPARGIFQMEPATLADIFKNYLAFRPEIEKKLLRFYAPGADPDQAKEMDLNLTGNLLFQIAIARIHYLRVKEGIPSRLDFPDDDSGFNEYIMALAQYWKTHWNTELGAGTAREAFENYQNHVLRRTDVI